MDFVYILTSVLVLIAYSYLAMYALYKYFHASRNNVAAFLWGLNAMSMVLSVVLGCISNSINNQVISVALFNLTKQTYNLAIFLQLFAVVQVVVWCPYYGNKKCRRCLLCKKKLKRAIPLFLCVVTALTTQLLSDIYVSTTDVLIVDKFLIIIHLLVFIYLSWSLGKFQKKGSYLYLAYVLLSIKCILELVLGNLSQVFSESLFTSSTIIMVIEVLKMIKISHNEGDDSSEH